VPFESVDNYQFAPGPEAPDDVVAAMREVVTALDRPLTVPADPDARARALRRLSEERIHAQRWLDDAGVTAVDLDPLVRTRSGDPALCALLAGYLRERRLEDMEADFAETYVSNARSGEVVKGHAIVLAELGLCPFSGTVVRDASLFHGRRAKDRRAQHLLSRMGFVQALFHRATPTDLRLFRGLGVDGPLPPPRPASFVSATFSFDVAIAHFHADRATAALYRQRLPVDRLFMTFVETSAMNRQFREAEAVLIGDPDNRAF